MKSLFLLPLSLLPTASYTTNHINHATKRYTTPTRRNFLNIAASVSSCILPKASNAADSLQDVYFGAGCFWHVQHEFILAERSLLNRKNSELTSRTGYAGGFKTDNEGRVCYHNFQSIADYGKLGHGEVVGMSIPEERVGDFSVEYFKLFGDKGGTLL